MPKKQTTAGKKARAAARAGEKYTAALRRQSPPGSDALPPAGPDPALPTSLAHRRLLDHAPDFRPFSGTGLFERVGGQPTIDRLIDLLYAGISDDDQLHPLFGPDLAAGRRGQKLFYAEWLGGPDRYSEQAHAGLRRRHNGLPITPALADRWLGHFHRAVRATVTDEDDRRMILAQVRADLVAVPGRGGPGPGGQGRRGEPGDAAPGLGCRGRPRGRGADDRSGRHPGGGLRAGHGGLGVLPDRVDRPVPAGRGPRGDRRRARPAGPWRVRERRPGDGEVHRRVRHRGKRLRLSFLNVPARLARTGRRLHLRFAAAYAHVEAFAKALRTVQALPAFG